MCEIRFVDAAMSRAYNYNQIRYTGAPNKRLLKLSTVHVLKKTC